MKTGCELNESDRSLKKIYYKNNTKINESLQIKNQIGNRFVYERDTIYVNLFNYRMDFQD